MRALVGGIVHESSTFVLNATGPTSADDFDVHVGPAVTAAFEGTDTVVGGYLAACRRHGVEVVPTLHARAEPGAAVDPAAYGALERRLLDLVRRAGPVEVVLLDLHGAGTLVTGQSLDLLLLRRIRDAVGADVPIAVTCDLHANLPVELPPLVDVLVGFLEYPHVDMGPRADLAAHLAVRRARGQLRTTVRALHLDMLLPPSTTLSGPGAELRDLAAAAGTGSGVLACTVFHGFPFVDTAQAATSVVTVADHGAAADGANLRVGRWLWANRDRFLDATLAPAEAVAKARALGAGPVVIGDATDNPGSGSTGDSTHLLRALLDSGARACFATIADPRTVARAVAAGAGSLLDVELGGRHGRASGPPVRASARVRTITDGRVVQQVMRRGKVLEFGPCVRLEIGTVDVIVASRRSQVFDPEILLLHGALPERYDIVAVKSMHHFRAGFAPVAAGVLVADAPGPFNRAIEQAPRTGPTAARWPMNPAAVFPSVPGR